MLVDGIALAETEVILCPLETDVKIDVSSIRRRNIQQLESPRNNLMNVVDMRTSDGLEIAELEEMEFRCRAATGGPWDSYVVGRDSEAGLNCIGTAEARYIELLGGTVADQDFIAHAREDLPRLILEVYRLRASLEAVQRSKVSAAILVAKSSSPIHSVAAE